VNDVDALLLFRLQSGIPLLSHPFRSVGATLNLPEDEVLTRLAEYRQQGLVRRVGGVFNAVQFGYQSALCGLAVPVDQLDSVVAHLKPHQGITHCYTRSARPDGSVEAICLENDILVPNLWFTLSVPASEFDVHITHLQGLIPYPIRVAPATQRFKVQVVLDPSSIGRESASNTPDELPLQGTQAVHTTHWERRLVRLLQNEMPLVLEPWKQIAEQLESNEATVLATLNAWQKSGALRRVALLARHQKIGFQANAMCAWDLPSDRIEACGMALAAHREVSHCYERTKFPGFPFNLYAMIHSDTMVNLRTLADQLAKQLHSPRGLLFVSGKEYKKTSLKLFE